MNGRPDSRHWTAAEIPELGGRTAVVTGANSGVGYETARMLAERGAAVVLACRNPKSAAAAIEGIRRTTPAAELSCVQLDLMNLASVREAAAALRAGHRRIDLLINNAGAACKRYHRTVDGFEATLATNHLGAFALTGLLLDRMASIPGARIVSVSSQTHRAARLNFDDLHCEREPYRYLQAYARAKLANLLFTFELHRRLESGGARAIAVAAHPGSAQSGFAANMGALTRVMSRKPWYSLVSWSQQSAAMGALATLRAAVDGAVCGGDFYGPTGLFGFKGHPELIQPAPAACDSAAQARLWAESERLTGVVYATAAPSTEGAARSGPASPA